MTPTAPSSMDDMTLPTTQTTIAASNYPRSLVENEINYLANLIRNTRVNRLLDEILFHIFFILVQESVGTTTYPWTLTAVCRRWRNLCLNNPRLWSYVTATIPNHHCRDDSEEFSTAYVSAINLQLKRAQILPLFINIDARLCSCLSQVTVLRDIASRCHRWAELTYTSNDHRSPRFGGDTQWTNVFPQDATFSRLKRLTWEGSEAKEDFEIDLPDGIPSKLVNLRDANFISTQSLVNHKFSWAQLQILTVDYHKGVNWAKDLFTILSSCESLVRLYLSIADDDWTEDSEDISEDSLVILPNLIVIDVNTPVLHKLVPYLRLPALRRLRASEIDAGSGMNIIENLLQRSTCSLSKLDIAFCDGELDFSQVLGLCPSLESLVLRGEGYAGILGLAFRRCAVVESLVQKDSQKLCPMLKTLELVRVSGNPVSISQMLESRLQRNSGAEEASQPVLKTVKIQWPRHHLPFVVDGPIIDPTPREMDEFYFNKSVMEEQLQEHIDQGSFKLSIHLHGATH